MRDRFDEINVFLSASETHNRKNVNRSIEESLERPRADDRARAREAGLRCEGVISTSFGCPYEGEVPPERVFAIAERLAAAGCEEVGFGDTTGMANPRQVREFFAAARERLAGVELTAHFHNTRGQGLANVLAALEAGRRLVRVELRRARRLPGAARARPATSRPRTWSRCCTRWGSRPGSTCAALIEASRAAQELLGRPLGAHVLRAGPGRLERPLARREAISAPDAWMRKLRRKSFVKKPSHLAGCGQAVGDDPQPAGGETHGGVPSVAARRLVSGGREPHGAHARRLGSGASTRREGGQRPASSELLEHVAQRLCRAPRYRQMLAPVPLGLNAPVWVDDHRFDVARHVVPRSIATSSTRSSTTCMSEPLRATGRCGSSAIADRLDDGRVGVVGKAHHCMVDGIAAVELASLLLDPSPTPTPAEPDRWRARAPRPPARRPAARGDRRTACARARAGPLPARLANSPGAALGLAGRARRAARALVSSARPAPPAAA